MDDLLRLGRPRALLSTDVDETDGLYLDKNTALRRDVLGLDPKVDPRLSRPVARLAEPEQPESRQPLSTSPTPAPAEQSGGPISFSFPGLSSPAAKPASPAQPPKESISFAFPSFQTEKIEAQTPAKKPGVLERVGSAIDSGITSMFGDNKPAESQIDREGLATFKAQEAEQLAKVAARRVELGTDSKERGDAMKLFDSAAAGLGSAISGTLEFIADKVDSDSLRQLAEAGKREAMALTPKEQTTAQKLASAGGSMMAFMAPGLGVVKGMQLAGFGLGAARTAGAGAAALLESAGVAQETYEKAMSETGNKELANERAWTAAALNLPLAWVTNKLGLFGEGSAARQIGMTVLTEGAQEGSQQILTNKLGFKDVGDGFSESAAIGGLAGGGFKGGQLALERLFKEATPDEKENLVKGLMDEGMAARQQVFQSMMSDERTAEILRNSGIESADDPRFTGMAIQIGKLDRLIRELDMKSGEEVAEERKRRSEDLKAAFGDTASTGVGVGTGANAPLIQRSSVTPNNETHTLEGDAKPVVLPEGETTPAGTLALSPEDLAARQEGYEVQPAFGTGDTAVANRFVSLQQAETFLFGPKNKKTGEREGGYASTVEDMDFRIRQGKRSKEAGGGTFYFVEGKPKAAVNPAVAEIDAKANEAATSPQNDLPQPTEAQKKAGTYKKGRVKDGKKRKPVAHAQSKASSEVRPEVSEQRATLERILPKTADGGAELESITPYSGNWYIKYKVTNASGMVFSKGAPIDADMLVGTDEQITAAIMERLAKNGIKPVSPDVSPASTQQPQQTEQSVPSPAAAPTDSTPAETVSGADLPKTEQVKRKRTGGDALRSATYDRNPFLAFLGKHGISLSLKNEFAPDSRPMISGYGPMFRRTGLMLDDLATRAAEEGFLPRNYLDAGGTSQLETMIDSAIRGTRIDPLYGFDGDAIIEQRFAEEQERQREIEAEQSVIPEDDDGYAAAEREAMQAADSLTDTELFELDDAAIIGESNISTADAMRALGFTEQEIQDELAREAKEAESRQGAVEAAPEQESGAGQEGAGEARPAQRAEGEVTERKSKDEFGNAVTEVTLPDGSKHKIIRLNSTESMGLPGWHDATKFGPNDGGFLGNTKDEAIKELIARRERKAAAPKKTVEQKLKDKAKKAKAEKQPKQGKPSVERARELWEDGNAGDGTHIAFDSLPKEERELWIEAEAAGYIPDGAAAAQRYDQTIESVRRRERANRAGARARGRRPADDEGTFRLSSGGKGMEVSALLKIVDAFKANWANMPETVVVAAERDLPARLYGQVQRDKAEGLVAGAYYNGKVYLVANNISDLKDAVVTVNHEVAGHFGLRSILGDKHAATMREIYDGNKAVRTAADSMMVKEGLDLETAVEEVIADFAESGKYPESVRETVIQRIYAAIRRFMRDTFGVKFVSDAELREIVSNARRYVEVGDVAEGEGGAAAADASIKDARATRRQQTATFYSALERAFRSNKTEKMPAAQWKSWLASNSAKLGVRKGEIEWVGINDWLDLKGDERVTKQELLDFIAGNRVYVNEIVLNGPGKFMSLTELKDMYANEFGDAATIDLETATRDQLIEELGLWENPQGTKHNNAKLTLPGGRNYVELVLTDPTIKSYKKADEIHFGDVTAGKAIGWLRMNVRKDAQGRDVLFLEELQSQRGQDARRDGLSAPEVTRRDDGQWELRVQQYVELYAPDRFKSVAEAKEFAQKNMPTVGTPTAPFIKETSSWTGLLLKRAIAYAQSQGIDRIAWTTGEQQNERHDLRKSVDTIYSGRNNDGTWEISASKGGKTLINKSKVKSKELPSIVGKDMAEAIIASGDGIKLEGDDMAAFQSDLRTYYNQTVPSVAKDIVGKNGVEVMEIDGTGQQLGFVIPESLQKQVEEDGLPMFRRKDYEAQFSDLPAKVREMALAKGHYSPPTIKERLDALKPRMWLRVVQKTFDKFRPVKDIDLKAYMQLRLSNSPQDGAVSGLLHYGQVYNDDGALNLKKDTKGLLEILKPVGGEVDRFLMWTAANRAAALKKQDRENFFSDDEIAALSNINRGTLNDGKSRAGVYASVLAEMNELNKSVLDVARSTGLIDDAAFKRFSSDIWYVPFYRQMEEDGSLAAANTSSGAVGQYLSKQLKGSTRQLNDLMENVLLNWSHILSASMKNQAANSTLESATEMGGIVTKLTPLGDGKFGKDKDGNKVPLKYAVKTMVKGKESYWEIQDEFLLASLDAVASLPQNSMWLNIARDFKTTLTRFISLSPTFKINNLIRDSIQSIGLTELSNNLVANVMQGYKAYKGERAEALVGGGLFAMGNAFDGDQAANVKRLLKQGVPSADILTTQDKAVAGLKRWWSKYDEISDAMENANRLALYQQLRANGATHLEAAYAARDLQDFSLQGSGTMIRYLSQIVPYFNARLQGMYKLGRDGLDPVVQVLGGEADASTRQKAAKFSTVLGAVTLMGVALYLINSDDEDYQKLEGWQRDSFFWVKIPGTSNWLRIPKPFEMGAFATVAERLTEQMVDDKVEGKLFAQRLKHVLLENLAMNPMPQVFKPLYEIATNKDGFTGRAIESQGMERLSKENRVNAGTSDLAVGLNKVNGLFAGAMETLTGGAVKADSLQFSPIQIDYLVRGYLGWLGSAILTTSNVATAPLKDGESSRFERIDDFLVIGNYVKTLPQSQSKYVTSFYENAKIAATVTADYQNFIKLGQIDKATELAEEKGDLIALNKMYTKASSTMSKLTQQIKLIEDDKDMPGDVKRAEIEKLQQLRINYAKQIEDAMRERRRGFADGGIVKFDPEGEDYDYETAKAGGLGPDGTGEDEGHWGSVTRASDDDRKRFGLPDESYIMLKGRKHETWGKAVAGEEERGSEIIQRGGRYYSVPKRKE